MRQNGLILLTALLLVSPHVLANCDQLNISIFNAGIEKCRLVSHIMPSGQLTRDSTFPFSLAPGKTYTFSLNGVGPKGLAEVALRYECGAYQPAKGFFVHVKGWYVHGYPNSQVQTDSSNNNISFPVTISETHQPAGYYTAECNETGKKELEPAWVHWTVIP